MRKPHRPVLVQTPVETEGDGLASRTLADPEKLDRPLKHFENADFRFFFFCFQAFGSHSQWECMPKDLVIWIPQQGNLTANQNSVSRLLLPTKSQ